ncbi:MAG: signal peptidase I [Planctomycetes bacterium]|nr:signal peptidase I [Planctomycetota bacterium]
MFGRRKKAEPQFKLHMPWRENLETLSAAIVMALVLKFFVVEAYKIPTGSMQPTLMGDDGTQIYDRILVDKFSFVARDPERWEVVVFKYPLDLVKNYVKRLVGLPGEKLAVADGNLWAATDDRADADAPAGTWKILRKPVEVQRDLWKELWSWEGGEKDPERKARLNEDGSRYELEVVEGAWRASKGAMLVDPAKPFRFLWPKDGTVRDLYRDGYPAAIQDKIDFPGRSKAKPPWVGTNQVGDLRFEVTLTPEADLAEIEIVLRAYQRLHQFRICGPAGSGESFVLWNRRRGAGSEKNPRAAFAQKLAAGQSVDLRAEVCDQRLRLLIDDEEVARVEFDLLWASAEHRLSISEGARSMEGIRDDDACRVELALKGSARIEGLRTFRDIHYLPEMARVKKNAFTSADWGNEFTLLHSNGERTPEGHYFMMGDNTQNSLDSRGWKMVTREALDGTEVSGNSNGMPGSPDTNPRPARGEANADTKVLRTTTGREVLVKGGAGDPQGERHAPYVARNLIVGKAVVVFWPTKPPADAMRWKFVR